MARKIEDSDVEFPGIVELVKRSKASPSRNTKGSKASRNLRKPELTKITNVNSTDDEEVQCVRKGVQENQPESSTSRLKKRVLKPTSANPLLLPMTTKPSKTVASRASRTLTAISAKDSQSFGLENTSSGIEAFSQALQNNDKPRRVRKTRQDAMLKERDSESEAEADDFDDSDSLSGFIVNDSSVSEEESSLVEPPLSRSTRRLVRGRKPTTDPDFDTEDLGLNLQKLSIKDHKNRSSSKETLDYEPLKSVIESTGDEKSQRGSLSGKHAGEQPSTNNNQESNSNIDESFDLQLSPSEIKVTDPSRKIRLMTPPGSPKMKFKELKSPTKAFPRIPMTPHRPSMDSFWQQDVINDWNDEYSPKKTLPTNRKFDLGEMNSSINSLSLSSPKKSSVKHDKVAKEVKKAFSQRKHALAEEFLIELDNKITDGRVSKLAEGTGGVKIIWSKKLNTTAGRANWRRETFRSKAPLEDGSLPPPTHRHHASIELAEKVIDDEDRLLNVIAHEFCHLANFMVSNIKTNPHGKEFKAWAAKCSHHFGHRGIEVTTKHSYSIDYKYVWECENCGLEFKRHSKSIDPARHQCGSCKSKLVQTKPAPRGGTGITKVNEYQMFVKENMAKIRRENPRSPQKDIMGLVGKKYQEHKASKLDEKSFESFNVEVVDGSKESPPKEEDDKLGYVVRKLEFFDLSSP